MKKKVWISVVSTILLGLSFSSVASADEVVNQTKETPANIEIKDNDDTTDPLDPTDPDQKYLTLEKVPEAYDFSTKLQGQQVETSATLDDSIDVFNDRIQRDWSVKAQVTDNNLALEGKTSKLPVNNFKINDTELVGTGATGIVAKAEADKTAENNTGLIETAVTSVDIKFTDTNRELKANDKLSGTITYQLYNTPDAK
ncbi:WxL domain-containing protein [Candidatus Enterococcus ferrettii]|uniref:WxL domain-containing protein n=1 Tax=Candidatus Enterococcus ferrettii TaxID=2815324 RepID=A0ABV0EMM8_9ENTE|nr:WxL domain-containing protein [Enterococcus sp. 665A]MBO1340914.1 WxL domain-containing protein [Enterococcus sp. 665A]